MTYEILTGRTESHLCHFAKTNFLIHREVAPPLENLFLTARAVRGFDFRIASAFRSFESQKQIWNQKAQGKRPILDFSGSPLDIKTMNPSEILFAILRWTALPGASRHHWGTDFDYFDSSAVPENYQLKLVSSEYAPRGVFADADIWMRANDSELGFFQPYLNDRGGTAPEAWHLSHKAIASKYLEQYTFAVFEQNLSESDFELIDVVRAHAKDIYQRFVTNI